MKSQNSDKQAAKISTTNGSTTKRQDNCSLPSLNLRSTESTHKTMHINEFTDQPNKKEQIKTLQNTLQAKIQEYAEVGKQIEQCKQEGELMTDFVNDQLKEYSILLARQQPTSNQNVDEQIKLMLAKKNELKQQTMSLHNINKVMQFELEVNQGMIGKIYTQKQQIKKQITQFDEYIVKTEIKLKQKQPNLDFNEMPQAQRKKKQNHTVGTFHKSQDEILQERHTLIDEYEKKIDQLAFQIQEITRTCILEKQEMLKKIQDYKEEEITLTDKILNLKLRIQKVQVMEEPQSSDNITEYENSQDSQQYIVSPMAQMS